ncbi:PAS domain S-box-containing protein/diguanylate cyclase (GGDEF) domain-containing protein [Desulfonatronum zhilinae]|nr:PAS domain S-box-containing protein/diguanylate cyclase (GGDEF) domain-containing protein [Desulfonatronum zhilinae]
MSLITTPQQNQTILVIDDDPAIVMLLKTTLTQVGYRVFSADTGTEGLEIARRESPDMVLLDVMLPDGSGLDFCLELKELELRRPLSVILMSGLATTAEELAQGLDIGADDYMAKPLAVNELLARVKALFRLRRAEANFRRSDRLLNMTQRLAKVGGWEWDVDRESLDWTEETYRIHGFSPDEQLSSRQWLEKCLSCYAPRDRETLRTAFTRCVEQGQPFDLELPFTSADGRRLCIRATAEAVHRHGRVAKVLGTIMDITRQKANQRQFEQISSEYERVFQSTQDAMFLIRVDEGPEFRFIRNNQSHQERTGLSLDVLRDTTPQELLGPEIGDELEANYRRCMQAGKPISYEERLALPGGERLWHTTLTPVHENGKVTFIVGSAQDITQRKKAEEKLRILSITDELTTLWNRRHFMSVIRQETQRAKRYGLPLTLLMLDIDYFKQVNDDHGHDVGDQVLREFAMSLKKHFREVDIPARLGGEEFAVLLPATGPGNAWITAERFREYVHAFPIFTANAAIHITVSIGAAGYETDVFTPEILLKRADEALYQAKNTGRNRTVVAGQKGPG